MIIKVGGKYVLFSADGRILGLHSEKESALRQDWVLKMKSEDSKGIIDVDYDEEEQQRMHQEGRAADRSNYPNNGVYTD